MGEILFLNFITSLLDHYGYIILFTGLLLELIALPTPGEVLMSYCGFLVYQNKLNWATSIMISTLGASVGITISYILGFYLGKTFFVKYGPYMHMGPDKIEKASKWFDKYGNKLLIVAYFIPGVRHITGYFSGITRIPYKKFAVNAYFGAIIWATTFISLGKTLGPKWETFHTSIRKYSIVGGLLLVMIFIVVFIYKKYKTIIVNYTLQLLKNTIRTYHSMGKIKIIAIVVTIIFLVLLGFAAGLIQDYLANEFNEFDIIVSFIVQSIFSNNWYGVMTFFKIMTMPVALIILTVAMFIFIMLKGKNKFLEIRFLIIVFIAGQILQEIIGLAFHRIGPLTAYIFKDDKRAFPSEQAFMAVVAYGFAAFIYLRHTNKAWLKPVIVIIGLSICLFTGLGEILYQTQYPSDVLAGYVFGGVWLSLNIIILEVFRVLSEVNSAETSK